MKLTIHRGTQEIGGSCVQITVGEHSVLFDAGSPLGETRSEVDLSTIDFSDVFISHPHQDHFGLIESLPLGKTVHIGETARKFIETTRIFLGKPPLINTFSPLINRTWVEIAPGFRVMPYLMDHSCLDAFGFLVEAEGKRIYYSGDFRAHGKRKQAFDWFLNDPPCNIDLLLMEGTMMGRDNIVYKNEDAVEDGMLKVLREFDDQACFLICSGQHIDRLCAAYSASLQTKRIFVVDIYTAYILQIVSERFSSVPGVGTAPNLKVLTKGATAGAHYAKIAENRSCFGPSLPKLFQKRNSIDVKTVLKEPGRYFLKISNFSDILRELDQCGVIYSMWSGYLQEEKYQAIKDHPKVSFHEIHTSGHAVREDLKRMAAAVHAKRIVPIHTEHGDAYRDLFGDSVLLLKDKEVLEI